MKEYLEDYNFELDQSKVDGVDLKQYERGSFGEHELLHTLSVILDLWQSAITNHPATLIDEHRYIRAREIQDKIFDFYQDM